MAIIQSYSSVSVVDLTDVGTINLYLTCNQPSSVIYDSTGNSGSGAYIPDWSSSNLVITPVVSYNGTNLSLTSTGLVITFTRQVGSESATSLTTGETVTDGILTVNENKMAGNTTGGQLTYICHVTYTNPDTNVPIVAENYLTFTLLAQVSEAKSA